MPKEQEVRETLPVHPSGRSAREPRPLRVSGLVGQPMELTAADLDAMPQRDLSDDFTCLEGWTVPSLGWRGVPLEEVLARAGALPEARWVQASSDDFSVPIPLEDARGALLATRLNGDALPPEHGGPVRLVVPGGDCFTSIKWLDTLELRAEPGENTGRTIALGRLPAE